MNPLPVAVIDSGIIENAFDYPSEIHHIELKKLRQVFKNHEEDSLRSHGSVVSAILTKYAPNIVIYSVRNVSDEIPIGTLIYKYGTATGFTYGTYTQYCTSYYDNDQNFYIGNVHGFYRYTSNGEFCDEGDSGGPVWLVCLSSRVLIGVISGSGIHNGNDVAYFASMDDFTSSGFVPFNLIEVNDDIWD